MLEVLTGKHLNLLEERRLQGQCDYPSHAWQQRWPIRLSICLTSCPQTRSVSLFAAIYCLGPADHALHLSSKGARPPLAVPEDTFQIKIEQHRSQELLNLLFWKWGLAGGSEARK